MQFLLEIFIQDQSIQVSCDCVGQGLGFPRLWAGVCIPDAAGCGCAALTIPAGKHKSLNHREDKADFGREWFYLYL